jgi:hypothetical protein
VGRWCIHSAILVKPGVPVAFSHCLCTWHSILQDVIAISINVTSQAFERHAFAQPMQDFEGPLTSVLD